MEVAYIFIGLGIFCVGLISAIYVWGLLNFKPIIDSRLEDRLNDLYGNSDR